MSTSISQLEDALSTLRSTTSHALTTSQSLSRRTRHLSTLTSPASETSSSLTQSSTNLTSTLALLRDAREKFDTVEDCEPSIERLYRGAMELIDSCDRREHPNNTYNVPNDNASLVDGGGRRNFYDDDTMTLATLNGTAIGLTEQDVYAAADSLEIIRDAHVYFLKRPKWNSSKTALTGLERVHQLGVDGMCTLIHCHLINAGPAIRMKRGLAMLRNGDDGTVDTRVATSTIGTNTTFGTKQGGGIGNPRAQETAGDTRERLSAALQNRDLMKSVGEYEESLPLDTRIVRELRAIFECLGGHGCFLNISTKSKSEEIMKTLSRYQVAAGKVGRTEKIGSGHYTKLTMKNLASGYPHLDAYSEARRSVAYRSMQLYYKNLRAERKKEWDKRASSGGDMAEVESGELDSSARDAVRCLEHAMVIVAGEKSIYRCVVSPTSSHTHDSSKIPLEYKYALVAAYSNVCGVVVDRVLDIIELFFVKDAALRNPAAKSSVSGVNDSGSGLDGASATDGSAAIDVPSVRFAASAAAAGLRILDAVRMLGPSLAKLCEMANDKLKLNSAVSAAGSTMSREGSSSLASNLCIAIHRMTVKNAGKALENLALAAKRDPFDGEKYRPKDARVAAVSSDVVRAIRLVSPFVNAYKSVTKRR
jgi:exocyst complex protein 7